MTQYQFYGWETANVLPSDPQWKNAGDPRHLYDLLVECWSPETCAPRMRPDWTRENRTLGQCSVTAFLVQDIYGGRVEGIPLPDGNYHCFNVVGNCVFDLTSEQFGNQELDYIHTKEQFREIHFAKAEKQQRYELLKSKLKALMT